MTFDTTVEERDFYKQQYEEVTKEMWKAKRWASFFKRRAAARGFFLVKGTYPDWLNDEDIDGIPDGCRSEEESVADRLEWLEKREALFSLRIPELIEKAHDLSVRVSELEAQPDPSVTAGLSVGRKEW